MWWLTLIVALVGALVLDLWIDRNRGLFHDDEEESK